MKIYTIRDIARLSGVGISTVSRVLNNRPDVHPDTRRRVMQVVQECNYTQNKHAKTLKQRDSAIVVIVRGRNNPFLAGIAERMLICGKDCGHHLALKYIDEREDEFQAAYQLCAERGAEGFIFLGGNPVGREEGLMDMRLPCVFSTVSAKAIGLPFVSSVSVDNRRAAREAVDYLLDRGHARIAVLGGVRRVEDSIGLRYKGVLDAYGARRLPFDERLYRETSFTLHGGYAAASDLLANKAQFTAVFAMSDLIAIGAFKALSDAGLRVPDDVSIVGFDGIDLSKFFVPSIATVEQPSDEIARRSVEMMVKFLDEGAPAVNLVLPTKFLCGGSVRRLQENC